MVKINETEGNILWNGITSSIDAQPQSTATIEEIQKLLGSLNKSSDILRTIDIVPIKRGFSKPYYSPSQISNLLTEDEIATVLGGSPYVEGKVMAKFKSLFGKIFKVRAQIGTALFYLQVTDDFGMTNELINDGFGLNQVVFILTKILRDNVPTIFLEEPEIHLHPSAQNRLARVLAEVAKEEKKSLIIETHSEIIVSAFLSLVAEKYLSPQDIRCYFLTKPKRETIIEEQTVNEKGQITSGLVSFMEEEIRNVRKTTGVIDKE